MMTEISGGVPTGFAAKLDRLFDVVRPPGAPEREYTHDEVSRGVAAAGGPSISATDVWMLRSGRGMNPTTHHLEALARFFGVTPAYFFAGSRGAQLEEQLAAWVATGAWLRDASRSGPSRTSGGEGDVAGRVRDPALARRRISSSRLP